MSFSITLEGYVPSPRFPPVTTPWTQAQISYSATQTGPFVVIDLITLPNPDANPAAPVRRDLTTLLSPAPSGWFQVTFLDSDGNQDPTNPISYPSPSLGAIIDGVYLYMPVTVSALRADSRFGDQMLQNGAEIAKYRLLGYTVPASDEQNLHILLLDYLSKRVALALVKPGIDYWSRQKRTSTSTQVSEVTAYPDIIKSLEDLGTRLKIELPQDWRDLRVFGLSLPQRRVIPMPVSSLGDSCHVTRAPSQMPPLFTGGYGLQLEFGVWPP